MLLKLFGVGNFNLFSRNASKLTVAAAQQSNAKDVCLPAAAPTKPLNLFARYIKENMSRVRKEVPNLHHQKYMAIVGKQWRELPAEKKLIYVEEHVKAMDEYRNLLENWWKKCTDEQKEYLKMEKIREKKIREEIEFKKKIISLGRPKQAYSAYNYFIKEKFNQKYLESTATTFRNKLRDTGKELAKEWKTISDEEKQRFIDMAKKMLNGSTMKSLYGN